MRVSEVYRLLERGKAMLLEDAMRGVRRWHAHEIFLLCESHGCALEHDIDWCAVTSCHRYTILPDCTDEVDSFTAPILDP